MLPPLHNRPAQGRTGSGSASSAAVRLCVLQRVVRGGRRRKCREGRTSELHKMHNDPPFITVFSLFEQSER